MIDRFKECVADLNIPKGWEDISYHNDACPSWLYNDFQIMILHPDPANRDHCLLDWPRFNIFHGEDSTRLVGQFETLNEVIERVK